MKRVSTTLYSLAAPLVFLPVMSFRLSEFDDYVRGNEFRTLLVDQLVMLVTAIADAFIAVFAQFLFGGVQ